MMSGSQLIDIKNFDTLGYLLNLEEVAVNIRLCWASFAKQNSLSKTRIGLRRFAGLQMLRAACYKFTIFLRFIIWQK